MTTIAGGNMHVLSGGAPTETRVDSSASGGAQKASRASSDPLGKSMGIVAALAASGVIVASGVVGGGVVGARLGQSSLGKVVGAALGIGAIAGVGLLMYNSAQNASQEYLVSFAQQPDLAGVPPGEVYATLRAHHERLAPAVERELTQLQDEEKVRSFSGIIGSNGFVVNVVRRHSDEVEQRLAALAEVGDVAQAELGIVARRGEG